jgi:hypothetical protein
VSMLPFVSVHLVLFLSMPWLIALASVLLAVIISFPLAYRFELGGETIWAPALLHFVIQATVNRTSPARIGRRWATYEEELLPNGASDSLFVMQTGPILECCSPAAWSLTPSNG